MMRRCRRGFTLAEVLVGFLLLVGIFFALAAIFPTSLASLRKSQHGVVAMNLARQTLEDWQTRPWSTLVETTTPQLYPPMVVDETPYTIVVTVSDPAVPDPNLKIIDVQVLVDQGGMDQAQVRDTTCVFNYTNPW